MSRPARGHHERGELDLAIASYRRVIERDPSRADMFAELGAVYYERGDVLEASYSCEKALQIDPENTRANAILARAFLDLGLLRKALPHALRAADTPIPEVFSLWTLAATFLQLGRYEDAERVYRMTLEANRYPELPSGSPANSTGLSETDVGFLCFGIGLACRGQWRSGDARAWYDSALVRIPDVPEVHYEKGILLERLGVFREALECYRRAIRIDPFFVDAQIRLGVMLYQLGELPVARDILLSVHYDYAASAEVTYTLGRIAEQNGSSFEALDYYSEARTIDEAMAAAWLREGLILVKLGSTSEGKRAILRSSEAGSSAAKWLLTSDIFKRPW